MTKAHINGKNRLIFLLTLVIGIMVLIVASKYAFQSAIILKERKMHQLSSFFMDFGLIAMYVECQFTELQKSINGTSY